MTLALAPGFAAPSGPTSPDIIVPQAFSTPRDEVPSPSTPQDALARAIAWTDRSVITGATVTQDPGVPAPRFSLDFTVRGRKYSEGGVIAAAWMADLAQGVFEEQLAVNHPNLSDVVSRVSMMFIDDAGKSFEIPSGVGDVVPGQGYGDQTTSDSELVNRLTDVVKEFGLQVVSIEIFQPLDKAAKVVVRLPSVDALDGKLEMLRQALVAEPKGLEGIYVEAQATDGTPIARISTAYRSGAGRLWVDPRYEGRAGAVHG